MRYQKIAGVKKPASRIVFGTAVMPMLAGEDNRATLDAAFAHGINTFDTAASYGLSEKSLGDWLAGQDLYDEVVILSKCGHPDTSTGADRVTPTDMLADFAQTQERLRTDFIDIYLLHRDDTKVEVGPIVETFNSLHRAGKIGAFGASNWTHERIQEANEYAATHGLVGFTVSSPNFGLANQIGDPWGMGSGCVTISGPQNAEARDWYRRTRMPVFAYSSLGRGFFSGRLKSSDSDRATEILDPPAMKGYACPENFERLARAEKLATKYRCTVPQIAIAWIFQQGLDLFALMSFRSATTIPENIAALDIRLPESECRWLDLATDEA